MVYRRTDDEDDATAQDLLWRARPDLDQVDALRLPYFSGPGMDPPWRYVHDLVQAPAASSADPAYGDVDDLRTAARNRLTAAGLYDNPLAPYSALSGSEPGTISTVPDRPPPQSGQTTILGDDTAFGPGRRTASPAPVAEEQRDLPAPTSPSPSASDATTAPSLNARPPAQAAPSPAPSLLDSDDAKVGVALTAADALLRRGVAAVAGLVGADQTLLRQLVDSAAAWLGGLLPPEYKASIAKSAQSALADAERGIESRARETHRRAAVATLAERRAEAEQEYADAMTSGDPAKIAEKRRDLLEASRAERRARGDGEAEINAGVRTIEDQSRKAAIKHRVAQLPDAEQDRFAREDPDAQADPETARRAIEQSRRVRREDPARAGEASIEREIERRKRQGLIDTPEEEAATRYRLRLDAQARRGIPEDQRRLLSNDERTTLLDEYRRIASTQGEAAADTWLRGETSKASSHSKRFEFEIAAESKPQKREWSSDLGMVGSSRQFAELPPLMQTQGSHRRSLIASRRKPMVRPSKSAPRTGANPSRRQRHTQLALSSASSSQRRRSVSFES
jgi:hypothetical protein